MHLFRHVGTFILLLGLSVAVQAQEQLRVVIPHLVTGSGVSVRVAVTATAHSEGAVNFFDQDGNPLILPLEVSGLGQLITNSVPFSLNSSATLVMTTSPEGALGIGFAVIDYESANEIAAVGVFRFLEDGIVVEEAGIEGVLPSARVVVPVELSEEGANVGIAAARFSSRPLIVTLVDEVGGALGSIELPRRQEAQFITELFPDAGIGVGFKGSIRIQKQGDFAPPFAATALRTRSGGILTSSVPTQDVPPTQPPVLAVAPNGLPFLIGVGSQETDVTRVELQIKSPATPIAFQGPLWTSAFIDGADLLDFNAGQLGTYMIRARSWNGAAPGPFTPIVELDCFAIPSGEVLALCEIVE